MAPMDPAHVNVRSWADEAATLGRIIATTGAHFTSAERAYWVRRLHYAAALESERGAA